MLNIGINHVSNKTYHSAKEWLSSSSLKKLLKDPSIFYKEEILQQRPEEKENPAFEDGSLMHSLILEPEKVASEYAFYTGLIKRGREFEEFKAANPGKTVISAPQKARCLALVRAHENNKIANELLQGGFAEYTICQVWKDLKIKVRCDYINIEKGYILDVKSTGRLAEIEEFKQTISMYKYDLSAALYCAIAEIQYGKPFDFYFDVLSKKDGDVQVYKLSEATKERGYNDCALAARIYKECMTSGNWPKVLSPKHESQAEVLEV
jgi:hypothetical protein